MGIKEWNNQMMGRTDDVAPVAASPAAGPAQPVHGEAFKVSGAIMIAAGVALAIWCAFYDTGVDIPAGYDGTGFTPSSRVVNADRTNFLGLLQFWSTLLFIGGLILHVGGAILAAIGRLLGTIQVNGA